MADVGPRANAHPILSLVIDRAACRRPLDQAVGEAVRAGVDWVQIRDRSLEAADLLAHAREVSHWAREAASRAGRSVRVVVNRRIDVALAIGADGVHLGGDALAPADARELLGPASLLGVSCHSPAECRALAESGCADYAHLAPILDPLSKPSERPALGLRALLQLHTPTLPVLAQGGVTAANCADLVRAGAAGVAVTGAVLGSSDPGGAAARLRAALDAAGHPD